MGRPDRPDRAEGNGRDVLDLHGLWLSVENALRWAPSGRAALERSLEAALAERRRLFKTHPLQLKADLKSYPIVNIIASGCLSNLADLENQIEEQIMREFRQKFDLRNNLKIVLDLREIKDASAAVLECFLARWTAYVAERCRDGGLLIAVIQEENPVIESVRAATLKNRTAGIRFERVARARDVGHTMDRLINSYCSS